jgi:hypothetical protein
MAQDEAAPAVPEDGEPAPADQLDDDDRPTRNEPADKRSEPADPEYTGLADQPGAGDAE